jgi:hypothetical protein
MLVPSALGALMLYAGERAGDRPHDATLARVEPLPHLSVIRVTVRNSDRVPVLVGLSLRRCGIRIWLEDGLFVRVPRRTTRRELLAGRQATVGVVNPGRTATMLVPVSRGERKDVQLVAILGHRDRLRVEPDQHRVHRRVALLSPC